MELLYTSGGEYVKLVIDRKNKKLQVASSKTNYQLTPTAWKNLFDKGQESTQEKITDGLDDAKFIAAITQGMAQIGYKLSKCSN